MRATTLVGVNQHTLAASGHEAGFSDDTWAEFLAKHLHELAWENLDLAKATGLDRSQVSRWLRHEGQPTPDSIRKVCKAFGVDIRRGIVAAGLFTADEMKLRSRPSNRELLSTCTAQELAAAVLDRMTGGGEAAAPPVVGQGTFTEQHRPTVVAPITFQDGRHAG